MQLADVLATLPADPRVVVSGNHAVPRTLLGQVDAELERYRLWVLNAPAGIPDRAGVGYETPFVGAGMRGHPRLDYVPMRLSLVPRLFRTTMPPDLVLVHTTVPHAGKVSLGIEVNVLPAAIEAARERGARVVAQANPRMPWTYGDAEVPVEAFDLVVEIEEELGTVDAAPLDAEAAAIGARVADRVADGSTLQSGIGAVPDATFRGLTERRDLRIWTEMFSDSVMTLDRAEALDRTRPIRASFLFGSADLLSWVDRNDRVRMIRTETVNDPALIAAQPAMVSVNTALQVDLFA